MALFCYGCMYFSFCNITWVLRVFWGIYRGIKKQRKKEQVGVGHLVAAGWL